MTNLNEVELREQGCQAAGNTEIGAKARSPMDRAFLDDIGFCLDDPLYRRVENADASEQR